jgi:hypothetical protein
MSNNDQINEAIAILQTMNMEDCAPYRAAAA